jgi:hypothetical protein
LADRFWQIVELHSAIFIAIKRSVANGRNKIKSVIPQAVSVAVITYEQLHKQNWPNKSQSGFHCAS